MFTKKPTFNDPVKELTGEYLRAADKLVREKRYQEAIALIEKANALDPKNMYTHAFLERTQYLIQKENETSSKVFGEIGQTGENRMEAISQLFATVEKFIGDKKYPNALNALSKIYHIDPKNFNAKALSDRIRTLMQSDAAERELPKPQTLESFTSEWNPVPFEKPVPHSEDVIEENHDIPPLPPAPTPIRAPAPVLRQREKAGHTALYRELLKECWSDGVITPEESEMLHRARLEHSISFDMHCRIEVEIKIDAYVDALRIVWIDGVVTDNEQEVLEVMRNKYGITEEEQAAAEKKFSAGHKIKMPKAMILIVDDDYDNSIYVARALINHGYDVKIERHPNGALRFMNTHIPDLILSEAVFPQLDTDGFEFFQKTRSDNRLNQIPFLIMTKPGDARIMRAGLRMGVDYFIPKPLHLGYMSAIIDGKIKPGLKMAAQM
ncbi:MAG: response regulator [Ignavibacteriae bacterium]|nr:MAG: response regulator [Ignavibacteriota bacterium]